jgi:hypothetical protein
MYVYQSHIPDDGNRDMSEYVLAFEEEKSLFLIKRCLLWKVLIYLFAQWLKTRKLSVLIRTSPHK